MDTTYTLVGSPCSLYTGKLRSYLHFKKIPFEETLSTQSCFRELIIPRTGVQYIPVLVTPDNNVWQDTTVIIDKLESRFTENPIITPDPVANFLAELLHFYADEWLVIPAMHYRWSYEENRRFAYGEFGYTAAPEASPAEQLKTGQQLATRFAGALPVLGVSEDTIGAIEQSYSGLLSDLNTLFSDVDFLLGNRPTIADFGFYGPLYAHLGRDPYSKRLMDEQAPNVSAWLQRMAFESDTNTDFIAVKKSDEIDAMIARMAVEMESVIIQTLQQVAHFAKSHDKRPVPRAIGDVSFTIGEAQGKRKTFPFMQWKWQRVQQCFNELDGENRTVVENRLLPTGLMPLLTSPVAAPLVRRENELWFA